jgi:Rrf2 family protein
VDNVAVKITVSVEYALQALTEIASRQESSETALPAHEIAHAQEIPAKFLESILRKLKKSGVLNSTKGPNGGYTLARSSEDITVADIIRSIEGPLAAVGDRAPEATRYRKSTKHLTEVWIATRVALRDVLENVTLEDIVNGQFDNEIRSLLRRKDAWTRRTSKD